RNRGAANVILEVRADNLAALGLYEHSGYAVLSTRRRYYQPGDVDAIVMRKSLQEKGADRG
ncbi:MAG TPA: ribosomal-protein-alanine N-acetyltransferase RimI, partial [Ornithinibacter sp.]|nr:ribosomal-protein-alanine N-acetyltransferase RimI [Ornithinibacter sp.]